MASVLDEPVTVRDSILFMFVYNVACPLVWHTIQFVWWAIR